MALRNLWWSTQRHSLNRSRRHCSRPRLERLEDRTLLSAGDLDPTFGMGGKVSTDFQGVIGSESSAAAQQPDGKIVVVGSVRVANSFVFFNVGWGLARYDPDGNQDITFGNRGTVITRFGPLGRFFNYASAVAIQGDGRIIVAGRVVTPSASNSVSLGLVRYNPDGSLDVSFGSSGMVISPFPASAPQGISLQADGKIIVAFLTTLARYNSDGSLDSSFGSGGTTAVSFGVQGVAVQADGKIIAVGFTAQSFAVARYDPSGTLDPNFGSGGVVTTKFGTNSVDGARTVVFQPGGKIVVGGTSTSFPPSAPSVSAFALARYNNDGSLDGSFGSGGKLTISSESDTLSSLALQADGKIVAGGGSISTLGADNYLRHFTVVRYTSDGGLDTSFGTQGKATGVSLSVSGSVLIENTGRIVLAGTVGNPPVQNFSLLGLTSSGVQDTTFGTAGQVITTFIGPVPITPAVVLVQPDGKPVIASTVGFVDKAFALTRYNADGSLDTAFGNGGRVITNFDDPSGASVTGAILLSDGKIFVTGNSAGKLVLARYNSDGQLDTSFGMGGTLTTNFIGTPFGGGPIVVQPDGKIILGLGLEGTGGSPTVLRLNPDGSQDPGFLVSVSNVRASSGVPGLVLQPDGKIIICFATSNSGAGALVRFNANGGLDTAFGSGGITMTGVEGRISIQADGRIVVAGERLAPDEVTQVSAVERFFSNGNPDTTFGIGGEILPAIDLAGASAIDFVVQPDNRIVLASRTTSGSFAVARFDPNGSLDATF
jgi:uncharacterized delta-60 repeat protein